MKKIEGHRLLFRAIVGSQAYGTNTPESDTDFKGVYIQSDDDILSFKYKEQINVTKDECYYEIRRFLELLSKGNPTVLELLYSPDDCIEYITPEFQLLIDNRDRFLTKECYKAFAGYGLAQIQKSTGLNKKQNIEREKVSKKDLLDFCYVIQGEKSINLKSYLKKTGYDIKFMGAANVPNAKDIYSVFYDDMAESCFSLNNSEEVRQQNNEYCITNGIALGFGYKGLVKVGNDSSVQKCIVAGVDENTDEKYIKHIKDKLPKDSILVMPEDWGGNKSENYAISNQLRLSSIPKGENPIFTMSYNKDGYTKYCKDYKEYQDWIKNRNTQRYVDYTKHGQSYDGKNMLHTMRLIETAEEIATQGTINVRRENAQELLKIRRGEVNLKDILEMAQDRIKGLDELYEKSNLPESIDMDYVNSILLQIRHMSRDSMNVYWNGNSDFEYGVKVLLSEKPMSKSIMKALEELSELSTKLLQYVNKPDQITDSDIEEEIVDCEMHFNLLKNYFPISASTRLRKIKKMLKSKDFKKYEKRYLEKNNAD